jgi:hypothetical protein
VRFYEDLADKRGLFYLFVSSGLLHGARKALQFIPEEVNLAVIGSSLTPGELRWLRDNVARPIHHIELPVDDETVWDFLFRANRHDFGWVDSDCFVLNPALFDNLAAIGPEVAVRCTWTHRLGLDRLAGGARPVLLARTHLMVVGAGPLREVQRRVGVSACTYNYEGSREGRTFERALYAVSKMPTRQQILITRAWRRARAFRNRHAARGR